MDEIIRELKEELYYQKKLSKKLEEELVALPSGTLCLKIIHGKEYVYIQQYICDKNGNFKDFLKITSHIAPPMYIRIYLKLI